jgi:hypothetical protein
MIIDRVEPLLGMAQWDTVVVCRYDPAGNIIGQKPY